MGLTPQEGKEVYILIDQNTDLVELAALCYMAGIRNMKNKIKELVCDPAGL